MWLRQHLVSAIAATRDKHQTAIASIAAVLAAIGFGMVPFFAKTLTDGGMAAQAVAFYRYVLVAVVLLPFLFVNSEKRRVILWGIVCGAAMGVGWTGYVKAIETVPVSTVGVLYMTYPMFTVLIAWAGFRQRPSWRSILAALTIMTAAIITATPMVNGIATISTLLFALVAPITFGFAINILVSKLTDIPPLSRIACVALGAVLGLFPLIVPLDSNALLPAAAIDWWMIIGIAIVTALIPQLLYVFSAPRIGAAKSAMAGSVELPTMFVVGWWVFNESITFVHLIAAAMVFTAIVITPAHRARSLTANGLPPKR